MKVKRRTIIYGLSIVVLLWTISCANSKEANVTITKDYVINPNWDKISNAFTITKMRVKDNNDSLELNKPTSQQLLRNLIKDTSFSFITNVKYNGENYAHRKVYFNRNNGFTWGKLNDRYSRYEQQVLGELQQETWYLLTGLGAEKTLYYIYLDSADSLHTFKVPASAWTNY